MKKGVIILSTVLLMVVAIVSFSFLETRFCYARLEEFLKNHEIPEDISFSSVGGMRVRLNETDQPEVYRVYLPQKETSKYPIRISFSCFSDLVLGDRTFHSGDEIGGYLESLEGSPVPMKIYAPYGELLYEGCLEVFFASLTPVIYMETADNAMNIVDNSEEDSDKPRIEADIMIFDISGETDTIDTAKVFRHGNSTFYDYQTKSYSFNLDTAHGILKMPPGRKWVLKANSMDNTQLLRNEAALDLAEIIGLEPCPEYRYVNLYINGKYNGLYMLTQRIDPNELMGFNYSNDRYLLENDQTYKNEKNYFVVEDRGIVIHYPEIPSPDEFSFIENRYNNVCRIIKDDGNYEKYIDVDSFVKMYVMQEFFAQIDVDQSSMFMYLDSDGKFHAGPLWDFDICCGMTGSRTYHEELMKRSKYISSKENAGDFLFDLGCSDRFMAKVRDFYQKEFTKVLAEYMQTEWEEQVFRISESMKLNLIKTERSNSGKAICDSPERLKNWILERDQFINRYLEDMDSYVEINYNFQWGNIKTAAKRGEPIGFMPDDEHEDNTDSFYGDIEGFVDSKGNDITDSFSPESDMELFAIYDD